MLPQQNTAMLMNKVVQGMVHNNNAIKSSTNKFVFEFSRGARSKASTSAGTKRIINQLSAMSASKKQPRVLKLCKEDLVRHQVVSKAWALYQKEKRDALNNKLESQYHKIKNAMDDLKDTNADLYAGSNAKEVGKRFSLELRAPTDFPPTEVWNHKFKHN